MSWTRLPSHFAGRPIAFRVPYHMPGELVVANNTAGVPFPDATFLHTVDKPFEIHRVIARVTPMTNETPPAVVSPVSLVVQQQSLQEILESYVRLRIQDTSKNENLTKNPSLMGGLSPKSTRVWEWEDPYTLVRAEGFAVTVDNLAPNNFVIDAVVDQTCNNLRIELAFQGYLIVVAPPSETR